MEFIIKGNPQPKQRPRVTTRGNYAHAYTPKETVEREKLIKIMYKSQGGKSFKDKPLKVMCEFNFEIPKSTSKKKAQKMLTGEIPCVTHKDIDNCLKLVLDALNGIAWDDDKQILKIEAIKKYSIKGYTRVSIEEVTLDKTNK